MLLFSCQNQKSDFIDFTDFNSYNQRSSLTISTYIHDKSDCGEWGGHKERIRLFKSKDNWRLIYARDSNNCHIYFPNREETLINKPVEFELSPNNADFKEIKLFVHNLEQYAPRMNMSSNATNTYSVKFNYGTITKSYDIIDISNDFLGYKELRTYLLERNR